MAPNAFQSDKQYYTFPLKVLIDKEKNDVVFVEAWKDFVDVLLSFLTLPLGTIARLVAKESNVQPVKVGSLSSLYESVSQLEEKHLWTEACKEMLLQPRNSMEYYCQQLNLNIDDTETKNYYFCEEWSECIIKPPLLSTFRNQRCRCGKLMNRMMKSSVELNLENGFVMKTASFIVFDDLYIMPNAFGASVNLFQKLGVQDMEAFEVQTVDITKKEVVDLLKFSLISRTPMTDLILRKEQYLDNFTPINQNLFEIGKISSDEGRQMIVKVQIRKSNGKVVFAEAEEEFVDFLFSFLTFPLGGVLHMLEGVSSVSCIDNLYRSMNEMSSGRFLISDELQNELANPLCAPEYSLFNQILPIGIESLPSTYSHYGISFDAVDPKSSTGESLIPYGYVKGPAIYLVTDDLFVTPMSSIFAVSLLNTLKVPLSDLEERVIKIGVNEGLGILKASLTSTCALTDGLKHFMKPIKEKIGPIT